MNHDYPQAVLMKPTSRLLALIRLIGRAIHWLTSVSMAVSAAGVLTALVLISYSVVARYLMGRASLWVDDVVTFILVGIVMFGAAAALREGRHLGVDLLTERLQGKARRWAQAWSMLAVLGVALFLVIDGWQTAMFSKMLGMTTLGYVQIPLYWLQLMIPFGGVLLCLVALESLLRIAQGGEAYLKPADREEP